MPDLNTHIRRCSGGEVCDLGTAISLSFLCNIVNQTVDHKCYHESQPGTTLSCQGMHVM